MIDLTVLDAPKIATPNNSTVIWFFGLVLFVVIVFKRLTANTIILDKDTKQNTLRTACSRNFI